MANNTLTDFNITGDTSDEKLAALDLVKTSQFCLEENRRNTFVDWPFNQQDGVKCTADAMAEAGFVHLPADGSPDAVRCFFCCKELDGWEAEDDPWEEHVSHARGKCLFLVHAKIYETEITRKKFLELEMQRQKNITKARCEHLQQRVKDQAEVVRKKMLELI